MITATIDAGSSKVVLVDEAYGDLQWEKGDKISVFDQSVMPSSGGYIFTAASSASSTQFVGPEGVILSPRVYGLYPAQDNAILDIDAGDLYFTVPSSQKSNSANSKCDFNILLVGASDKPESMAFYNACSGIRFTVSRNNISKVILRGNSGEILTGSACASFNDDCSFSVVPSPVAGETYVELTTSSTFSTGKYYYISLIPGAFYHGFSLEFYSATGELISSTSTESYKKLAAGMFGSILEADKQSSLDRIGDGEDLSVSGPSNCYLVNKSGTYKFPACMGNSLNRPVIGGASAEVLWSCNSFYKFDNDLIVSSVDLGDGYVYFKTPYVLENGSAVIAVRDAAGEILWSWHIWVIKDYDADAKAYHINGHTVMDRNVGALGVFGNNDLANGFHYQWGRKDPFPGFLGTTARPDFFIAKSYSAAQTTFEYSVANPTTFVYGNTWCDAAQTEPLWEDTYKNFTDPCPAGWRVPAAGNLTTSSYAFSASMYGLNLSDDNGKNCWVPMSGLIGAGDGVYKSYRKEAVVWTADHGKSVQMNLDNRTINFNASVVPSTGGSVRCIKD